MINTNQQKIKEILERWTDKIYPSKEEFSKALGSRKLIIYHGVDPTAPQLHLGHSTNYFLLRKFQELGHKVILLIGDFTAQIGDPTGKSDIRKALTKEEVKKNYKNYKKQAGKILDFKSIKNPIKIKFNSKWWERMALRDIIKLAANITYGQTVKRNMFQERLKNNQEIYLNEFLYPLFQGYDSVAMNVDAEIGGTDQTFNMLIGRDLVKKYKKKEKFVVTTPLLENPKTGKKLMSKSEGGFIALDDNPKEMFGKVMALPDEAIIPCFKLCTELSLADIEKVESNLKSDLVNPRDLKARLAKEIVILYHGEKEAEKAGDEFNKVFRDKHAPTEIPECIIKEEEMLLPKLLNISGVADSVNEAKRLILEKAVEIDGIIQTEWKTMVKIKNGMIIRVGKRRNIKIKH